MILEMEEIRMNRTKVLIYNDNNIEYIEGFLLNRETNSNVETERYIDGKNRTIISNINYSLLVSYPEQKDYIELDPTTMKRIAKYNKEVEIEKLNEEIKIKEKEIKELDNKLQDKEKRWEKVKKYIANIYDIDIKEDEDYWEEY
jgi:hypothetical protein